MYPAIKIAKYVVAKCVRDASPISNLQLQKILYFVQREYVRQTGDPLFSDKIEAWQFGPVVKDVYYTYSVFGGSPIRFVDESIFLDSQVTSIIDPIIEEKRALDPWTLVDLTHRPGGAWNQIFRNGAGNREEIPLSLIKSEG